MGLLVSIGYRQGLEHRYDILVVDDDPIVRAWLRAALRGTEFRLAGEAGSGAEALSAIERRHVDIVLLDLRLGGRIGTDVVRDVRRAGSRTPVVVMTAVADRGLNERAREAGAQGTLAKTAEHDELLTCLREVVRGGEWFDVRHPPRNPGERPLSAQEGAILTRLAAGMTNAEIARELAIGRETVKTVLERIYAKLGAAGRTEAVDVAHRRGLLGR